MLIQALDTSGSMSGAPTVALKLGAKMIGKKYFEAQDRPFEKFTTILYNNKVDTFDASSLEDYENRIDQIWAGGGTNFMNVFLHINQMLDAHPNTEEIVVIFITDGQDGYRNRTG